MLTRWYRAFWYWLRIISNSPIVYVSSIKLTACSRSQIVLYSTRERSASGSSRAHSCCNKLSTSRLTGADAFVAIRACSERSSLCSSAVVRVTMESKLVDPESNFLIVSMLFQSRSKSSSSSESIVKITIFLVLIWLGVHFSALFLI
uniref:Uncharacterized protein n=1 Tax=Anopheles christyi TaxID=43041 RepID=A0A182KIL3_9DIPT